MFRCYFLLRTHSTEQTPLTKVLPNGTHLTAELVVIVVVNFIKHQNRAITGERVAARAALEESSAH